MRKPSPSSRIELHVKQGGWNGFSITLQRPAAARASSSVGGGGGSGKAAVARTPSAISVPSWPMSRAPSVVSSNFSGVSSGMRARSAMVDAPSIARPRMPQTYPPLPEFGGPRNCRAITISRIDAPKVRSGGLDDRRRVANAALLAAEMAGVDLGELRPQQEDLSGIVYPGQHDNQTAGRTI